MTYASKAPANSDNTNSRPASRIEQPTSKAILSTQPKKRESKHGPWPVRYRTRDRLFVRSTANSREGSPEETRM